MKTTVWSVDSLLNTAVHQEKHGRIDSAWDWLERALQAEKNGGKLEMAIRSAKTLKMEAK